MHIKLRLARVSLELDIAFAVEGVEEVFEVLARTNFKASIHVFNIAHFFLLPYSELTKLAALICRLSKTRPLAILFKGWRFLLDCAFPIELLVACLFFFLNLSSLLIAVLLNMLVVRVLKAFLSVVLFQDFIQCVSHSVVNYFLFLWQLFLTLNLVILLKLGNSVFKAHNWSKV